MRRLFFASISLLVVFSLPAFAEPTGPQAKLPTIPLVIGDKKLVAEVADTEEEREAGLMFRKTLGDGEGMVFVFDAPQHLAFWMKNTILPLSVAYLSPSGTILEIHDLKPQDESPIGSKFDTIEYAIEVPQGWFLNSGILPGSRVQGLPAPKRQ